MHNALSLEIFTQTDLTSFQEMPMQLLVRTFFALHQSNPKKSLFSQSTTKANSFRKLSELKTFYLDLWSCKQNN